MPETTGGIGYEAPAILVTYEDDELAAEAVVATLYEIIRPPA